MGMFDDKQYLTGPNGMFQEGDTFFLHSARATGKVSINGKVVDEVGLTVSREPSGDQLEVYTSGIAIVNQVDRMDDRDRQAMPFAVKIDTLDAKPGQNRAHILRPVA